MVEITRGRAYTTARVEPAEDDPDAGGEATSALELYLQVAEATGAEADPGITGQADLVSYAIAARVEFPPAEKQRILEERSERGRLAVIAELLTRGLKNLADAAEIRDRAHTTARSPRRSRCAPQESRTTPVPPRRGSPAASVRPARISTAFAPPK